MRNDSNWPYSDVPPIVTFVEDGGCGERTMDVYDTKDGPRMGFRTEKRREVPQKRVAKIDRLFRQTGRRK